MVNNAQESAGQLLISVQCDWRIVPTWWVPPMLSQVAISCGSQHSWDDTTYAHSHLRASINSLPPKVVIPCRLVCCFYQSGTLNNQKLMVLSQGIHEIYIFSWFFVGFHGFSWSFPRQSWVFPVGQTGCSWVAATIVVSVGVPHVLVATTPRSPWSVPSSMVGAWESRTMASYHSAGFGILEW